MRVTLLQSEIVWGDIDANIVQAQRLVDEAPKSQLYVLPEMWATGFTTQTIDGAIQEEGHPALAWMRHVADSRHCAVCGSLAISLESGSRRNRHYFVRPNQDTIPYYDKHHLFTYGHENLHYTAGQQHTIVEWGGVRFLLLTCYDLRFPVWSRYGIAGEYDVIIVVANWPRSRHLAWQVLTRARAIENQCYLIGVNRVGADPFTTYQGASCVISPKGSVLGQADDDRCMALTVDLNMEDLDKMRSRFRVLDDRD